MARTESALRWSLLALLRGDDVVSRSQYSNGYSDALNHLGPSLGRKPKGGCRLLAAQVPCAVHPRWLHVSGWRYIVKGLETRIPLS